MMWSLVGLPIALGLLGFIEPCTIGSTMLFLHYMEGRSPRDQILQTATFALARAALMGALGAAAVLVGSVFVDYQKGAWALMGAIYIGLGIVYLTGHISHLKRGFGVSLGRIQGKAGAATLGMIFAFNIPACAGPLLIVLLGTAAVSEANSLLRGFVMLTLFGLALSLPLVAAVVTATGRKLFERLAHYSSGAPKVLGLIFIALGLWSIRFSMVANVI